MAAFTALGTKVMKSPKETRAHLLDIDHVAKMVVDICGEETRCP